MSDEEEQDRYADLTPEEQLQLQTYIEERGFPKMEEKAGFFQFFNKVLGIPDTKKAGNLDPNELLAVRLFNQAALYCYNMGFTEVGKYLEKEAEIVLSTSLSHKGFLIRSAITQRRELTSKSGKRDRKTGLFQKKEGGRENE